MICSRPVRYSLGLALTLAAVLCAAAPAPVVAAPKAEAGAKADAHAEPIDLNQATEADFVAVPGIGPALAQKIVEFRKQNGPFKSVEDLLKVRGIGERSFEKLRHYFVVGKKS